MTGLVIRNTGSHYTVLTDEGARVDCRVKGNFRLKGIRSTNPVAVGDHVTFIVAEGTSSGDGPEGWITAIDDRRNYVIRKASNLSKQSHILASNVDQCLLLVTVNYPETSTTFIDRFLATAEAYRIPVCIVINKMDRYDEAEQRIARMLATLYEGLGYPCHLISCKDDSHALLLPVLEGKTTLLSGNSGVGKSTLLNLLIPDAEAKTAEISTAHDAGMHTTTFSQMYF
ncbi:MAG: ribosome small subunit-dependent GTPase A, partial [Bacteroidaceae bacterium]|nr:ribosome small subunit-dependent GTPase A [Bacteroidaceae bacterium]